MKGLKNRNSRDPTNLANELFDPKVAGDDLIEAIQHLMNRIKTDLIYPECLKLVNITSIYKKKGPINEFSSYRGIFRVQALRNILELLLYYDEYPKIDSTLTECNVGCRKSRNIRDNIFVLQAILNDTKNGSKDEIDISVYDVEKCIDSLWVQECINDMFDAGVQSDKLNLLYLLNKDAQVAVKTSKGISERETISNIIMQGTVWGGMFCTTSMDKLGKLQYENEDMLYKYKGLVGVPVLEMVDDILDVKKCGNEAIKSNVLVNTFIEHKKLKMGKDKCHQIHCGKKATTCPTLKVHNDNMHQSDEESYLGDQISASANNVKTISKRRAKGYGIISDIMYVLEAIPNGKKRTKVGLELRQAWFLNSILLNMETWHNL